ncbi:MAG: hypothetical protein OXQ29_15480 [Rhodospirillaceae bacterium]|nr:hypothetical protein [Rhodospirillaceae bacterium]
MPDGWIRRFGRGWQTRSDDRYVEKLHSPDIAFETDTELTGYAECWPQFCGIADFNHLG